MCSVTKVPRRSKNEQLAARLGLTSSQLGGLVTQPREVVAALAEAGRFSEAEVSILRDIRRRGKNLIAAHSCRNRKLAEIEVDIYLVVFSILFRKGSKTEDRRGREEAYPSSETLEVTASTERNPRESIAVISVLNYV